jgi:Pyridoxamine 5'-phosphate oxidase
VGVGWADFEARSPGLAGAAVALFERYGVVLLGTNTRSGHPRLSLVEPVILDGELVIGTRAGDAKTADLRRDGRCSIHGLVGHRAHDEAEFKAALRALELKGARFEVVASTLARPEIRWRPTAAFALTVERASVARHGRMVTWPHRFTPDAG